MKKFLTLLVPALLIAPSVAFAQDGPSLGYFEGLVEDFQGILSSLVPVLIGLALVAILFGLVRYAFAAGNEEAQSQGRRIMVWGVIILFVMVSIWGLVAFLQNVTGIDGEGESIEPPEIPGASDDR